MAWRCSGTTNIDLVAKLARSGLIKSAPIEAAMAATDRGCYAPSDPYDDCPQSIGYRATISAPHMHAMALELLESKLRPGCKVLDVGCGSGYLLACLHRLLGKEGTVVGIDHIEELVAMSKSNLTKDGLAEALGANVFLELGDGWKGVPSRGPYDAIHVGAAAATVPVALTDQLKPGGLMVIPVGVAEQELLLIDKHATSGALTQKVITGVRYVPLIKH